MPRSTLLAPFASALLGATLVLPGCGTVECGAVPQDAITAFQVTVGTGDDATDADIYFCITRVSDPSRDCTKLGIEGIDDFDDGSIEDYEVPVAVDGGDLDRVWIENRGDAPDLSVDGDDWELASLRVVAITDGGNVLLFDAQDLGLRVDEGDEYDPECF
jgi:hypothetical protein